MVLMENNTLKYELSACYIDDFSELIEIGKLILVILIDSLKILM